MQENNKHNISYSVGKDIIECSSCLDISNIPHLDLYLDFEEAMIELAIQEESRRKRYNQYVYGYGGNDLSKEEIQSMRAYWEALGFACTDEEWEEWENQCKDLYNDIPPEDVVWPPMDSHEFEEGNVNKHSKGGTLKSQKYINGMEVDDDTFDDYNRKGKNTRRSGKKSIKKRIQKRKTKEELYHQIENDLIHERPLDSVFGSSYSTEEKKIVFYRTLNNTADTYEWSDLHEFNEWLDENGIEVKEQDISSILYREETHCCLDPTTTSRVLVVARSYGDLVWDITGGDEDLISQYSQSVSCPV